MWETGQAAKLCLMARNTSDTPRSRALGAKLRNLRTAHYPGSLRAFALSAGLNPSDLSKWELGHGIPSSEKVGVILGALGVTGEQQDTLIAEAKAAADPNWIAPGVDKQVSALIEYEKTADRMVSVAPLFTPGMLHTEDTARAVLANSGYSEGQVKAVVNARMARKEALLRQKPLKLEAFLGLRAITRPLGGREVALNQLRYTQKMMALTNVTVRVIEETDDFTPADMGAFVLYTFQVGEPIVYFEHHRSSLFAPKRDLPDMVRAVDRIGEVAMSPDDTSGLIADVIKRMETTL